MLNINRIMITGRLTRDPETKYLSSGSAVTTMAVAVNRNYRDRNDEWKEETFFIDVEIFGKQAERLAETLKKGRPVYVEGRLKIDTWERDGQKQSKPRISADRVTGFDVPQRQGGGEDDEGGSEAPRSRGPNPSSSADRSSSGSPSDNLDFGNQGGGVEDDIPF